MSTEHYISQPNGINYPTLAAHSTATALLLQLSYTQIASIAIEGSTAFALVLVVV